MNDLKQERKQLVEKANSWFADKPYWVWILSYTVMVAFLFGLFYTATRILTDKWWAAVIIVILTGLIWSWMMFTKNNQERVLKNKKIANKIL